MPRLLAATRTGSEVRDPPSAIRQHDHRRDSPCWAVRSTRRRTLAYAAEESVLQLGIGDQIRLTAAQVEELRRDADVGYTGASASVIFGCLSALDRPT